MSTVQSPERRQSPRRKPAQLVYVEFGRENGGMVKNVSEDGLRFSLMNRVAAGQDLHFGITIDPTRRIEGQARIVWTDASGKSGGMAFAEMSAESRATLLAWLVDIDAPPQAIPSPQVQSPTPVQVPVSVPVSVPVTVPDDTASSMRVEMNPPQFAEVAQQIIAQATMSPPTPAALPPQSLLASPAVSSPAVAETQPRSIASVLLPPAPQAPAPAPAQVPPAAPPPPRTSVPAVAQIQPTPRPRVQETFPETPRTVSRDDWKRSARESFVEERTARRSAALIAEEKRQRVPASPRNETRKFAELADQIDPAREFLNLPLGGLGHRKSETVDELPLPAQSPIPLPRSGLRSSRMAMILALAAISAIAGAFAVVAYRHTVGESLIRLGEKISGEPRPSAGPENLATNPAASQDPVPPSSKLKPMQRSDESGTAAAHGANATRPAGENAAPTSQPPPAQPSTQSSTQPITQSRPPAAKKPTTPQPQLASGREIVSGQAKYQPGDVSALWIAVENGDAAAEVLLANHYVSGEGVGKNCDQARVLLQAAAKRGNEAATKRLAELPAAGCQ
jgi:hypothetical protein